MEQLENRMLVDYYIEDDSSDEERLQILLEKDDEHYENEIFERMCKE